MCSVKVPFNRTDMSKKEAGIIVFSKACMGLNSLNTAIQLFQTVLYCLSYILVLNTIHLLCYCHKKVSAEKYRQKVFWRGMSHYFKQKERISTISDYCSKTG